MKHINTSEVTQEILKNFLSMSAVEQADCIKKLPKMNQKISAVEDILFVEKLYETIGLLPCRIVALAYDQYPQKETIMKELLEQPYFPAVWEAIAKVARPNDSFNYVPANYLVDAFLVRISQLDKEWEKVEEIINLNHDHGVVGIQFNLALDYADIEDQKEAELTQQEDMRKYERANEWSKKAAGGAEEWIRNLFECVTTEIKAKLLASIPNASQAKRLMGVFATYTCGAEKYDHFNAIVFGNYESREDRDGGVDIGLFSKKYSEEVFAEDTPAEVVKELLLPFRDYHRTYVTLVDNIPLLTLKKLTVIYPAIRKHFDVEKRSLLRNNKNIKFEALKQIVKKDVVSEEVTRMVKSLPPEKKLELIV